MVSVPYVDLFMLEALKEAKGALEEQEVPVGAVIVPLSVNQEYSERVTVGKYSLVALRQEADRCCRDSNGIREGAVRTFESPLYVREKRTYDIIRGRNATNYRHHALAHAEFICVEAFLRHRFCNKEAADIQGDKNISESYFLIKGKGPVDLSDCVLYVTVEPCIMCAAFLRYNCIAKVFFGCRNVRFGGNGSVLSLDKGYIKDDIYTSTTNTLYGDKNNTRDKVDRKILPKFQSLAYPSAGGYRAKEAIELLQNFYLHENPNAPTIKRKRKRAGA